MHLVTSPELPFPSTADWLCPKDLSKTKAPRKLFCGAFALKHSSDRSKGITDIHRK
jgi:hypothetical protein